MSWSGPAVTGQPYQQPLPYANGQPGYNHQQPYQYGQPAHRTHWQTGAQYSQNATPRRHSDMRPHKKKGNPVITRYAPPPGYRAPAQNQGHYGSNPYPNQYQHHPQAHSQTHQGYAAPPSHPSPGYSQLQQPYQPNQGYPTQAYGQPPHAYPQPSGYPQAGYPQGQSYQQPPQPYAATSQGYPQNSGYGKAPNYPGSHSHTAQPNTYQGYQAQPAHIDPMQQSYPQQQPGWQQQSGQTSYPPAEQHNPYHGHPPTHPQDPNATPTPASVNLATTQNSSATIQTDTSASDAKEKPQLYLAWDDWDFDFEGAIWPKSNEPVDPNLSLGIIIWRPGKQVTRALPSTFEEAEEQSLKPPLERLGNGESVSIYFTLENSHEAFLDVRQTDHWNEIKKDPVFVIFPADKDMELIPLEECIAKRDRPDELIEEAGRDTDQEMKDVSWSVMDNLEQALAGHESDNKVPIPAIRSDYPRVQKQEDILAMLGVTGSPKPPSNEMVPIPFPTADESPTRLSQEQPPTHFGHSTKPRTRPVNPPQRAHSYSGYPNSTCGAPPERQYGSMSAAAHDLKDQHNPWNSSNGYTARSGHPYDSSRGSPARSEGSNKTLAGSDFEVERGTNGTDQGSSSVPSLDRSDSSISRKRSYDDSDQNDEKMRQQDDHTKRKRRSEVDAAYSRR